MKPQRVRVLLLTCIAANLWVGDSVGQDTHYWSQHYGTRSTLLGGSVIGSLLDISSTYYNPGALALMADPAFVISGSIFGLRTLIFKNGAGQRSCPLAISVQDRPGSTCWFVDLRQSQ